MMELTHLTGDYEGLVLWGEFPPVSDWNAQIAHRDRVARAIGRVAVCSVCGLEPTCPCQGEQPLRLTGGHPSNGFQYGVDISAGNVECGYLKPVGDTYLIVQPDPETGELPEGAQPATYCFYDSWR